MILEKKWGWWKTIIQKNFYDQNCGLQRFLRPLDICIVLSVLENNGEHVANIDSDQLSPVSLEIILILTEFWQCVPGLVDNVAGGCHTPLSLLRETSGPTITSYWHMPLLCNSRLLPAKQMPATACKNKKFLLPSKQTRNLDQVVPDSNPNPE